MKHGLILFLFTFCVGLFCGSEVKKLMGTQVTTRKDPGSPSKPHSFYQERAMLDERRRRVIEDQFPDEGATRRQKNHWRGQRKIQPRGIYRR